MFGIISKALLKPTIPVIHINGPIMLQSSSKVQRALDKINPNTARALAIVVNSPGGLPVQSHIICSKIKNFAHYHHLPIYTFAGDVAASGGYFVLCIGDRVYAEPTSLVGSIGVIGNWFGVSQWLKKYKIENRKFTSNEKSLEYQLDPLDTYNPQAVETVLGNLQKIHKEFINHVENYRKMKLRQNELERLYSAEVFTGNEAVQLGLADYIGDYQSELKKLHPDCKIVDVSLKNKQEQIKDSLTQIRDFDIQEELKIKNIIATIQTKL